MSKFLLLSAHFLRKDTHPLHQKAQDKKYNEWLTELEKGYKISIDYDIWNDVTIGTVTTDIVTADDLAKMKEDASSSSSAK